MKSKDEVFDQFKRFYVLVEREMAKKLKYLRTDYGSKYTSKAFQKYCRKHVIRNKKTTLCTPQQNVIAERMNQTILERIQC